MMRKLISAFLDYRINRLKVKLAGIEGAIQAELDAGVVSAYNYERRGCCREKIRQLMEFLVKVQSK